MSDNKLTPDCPRCGEPLQLRASKIVSASRRSEIGRVKWSVSCTGGCRYIEPIDVWRQQEEERERAK